MIRPGPPALAPAACPDGLVVHLYAVPAGTLILEQRLTTSSAYAAAKYAAEVCAATPGEVCLVVYDGDSGRRWSAQEIVVTFS